MEIHCYLDSTQYLGVCDAFAQQIAPRLPLTAIEFKDNPNPLYMDVKLWLQKDGGNYSTTATFHIAEFIYNPQTAIHFTLLKVGELLAQGAQ